MQTNHTLNPMMTLDQFGARELNLATALLRAYADAGQGINNDLPPSFDNEGVYLDFNPQSGSVFLTNGYDALILDADHGQEDILPELAIRLLEGDYRTDQPEDVEFLRDALRDGADAFCDYAPVEQEPI